MPSPAPPRLPQAAERLFFKRENTESTEASRNTCKTDAFTTLSWYDGAYKRAAKATQETYPEVTEEYTGRAARGHLEAGHGTARQRGWGGAPLPSPKPPAPLG